MILALLQEFQQPGQQEFKFKKRSKNILLLILINFLNFKDIGFLRFWIKDLSKNIKSQMKFQKQYLNLLDREIFKLIQMLCKESGSLNGN